MDFKTGDKAKICEKIRRMDGLSVVYPGETVLITHVFQTETAWVLNIKPDESKTYYRPPIIDVVIMKNDPDPCLVPVV